MNGVSPFSTLITILAAVAMGISGWFVSAQTGLSNRVDTLSAAEAANDQKTSDVDARLTRIEDKLDAVLPNQGGAFNK